MERVGVGACRRIGVGDATLKKLGGASPPVPEKNRYAEKRRRANSSPYADTPTRRYVPLSAARIAIFSFSPVLLLTRRMRKNHRHDPACRRRLYGNQAVCRRSRYAYRCRRTIAIAAIMPKGIRMKSAMRMPIAKPFASGERPGGTATNRVSQSSSFMVPSELRIQYTDIAAVTD
jgi:hypothetical protein